MPLTYFERATAKEAKPISTGPHFKPLNPTAPTFVSVSSSASSDGHQSPTPGHFTDFPTKKFCELAKRFGIRIPTTPPTLDEMNQKVKIWVNTVEKEAKSAPTNPEIALITKPSAVKDEASTETTEKENGPAPCTPSTAPVDNPIAIKDEASATPAAPITPATALTADPIAVKNELSTTTSPKKLMRFTWCEEFIMADPKAKKGPTPVVPSTPPSDIIPTDKPTAVKREPVTEFATAKDGLITDPTAVKDEPATGMMAIVNDEPDTNHTAINDDAATKQAAVNEEPDTHMAAVNDEPSGSSSAKKLARFTWCDDFVMATPKSKKEQPLINLTPPVTPTMPEIPAIKEKKITAITPSDSPPTRDSTPSCRTMTIDQDWMNEFRGLIQELADMAFSFTDNVRRMEPRMDKVEAWIMSHRE
ncbi:Hypothetical protein D9617_1g088260 [Elsinoe fawcettii]|nr:Hypothetical protein D9617_1g088260 [Elsinoe fawcettii]